MLDKRECQLEGQEECDKTSLETQVIETTTLTAAVGGQKPSFEEKLKWTMGIMNGLSSFVDEGAKKKSHSELPADSDDSRNDLEARNSEMRAFDAGFINDLRETLASVEKWSLEPLDAIDKRSHKEIKFRAAMDQQIETLYTMLRLLQRMLLSPSGTALKFEQNKMNGQKRSLDDLARKQAESKTDSEAQFIKLLGEQLQELGDRGNFHALMRRNLLGFTSQSASISKESC